MLKERVLFLGLGNCGCKIAKLFGDAGYSTMYVNGSEQDLKLLGDDKNIYRLHGFDGFGGHRELAVECISKNIDFIHELKKIQKDIIFIVSGAGGSTGSGITTVAAELLIEENKIVCPICILPFKSEPIIKHANSYTLVEELQEIDGVGATLFLNNESNPTKGDYNFVNKNLFKALNMFLENNTFGVLNNFDESERIEMLREGGSFVLSMNKSASTKDIIDSIKGSSIFAPIEHNHLCGHIGIIHSDDNNSDIELRSLITEFGKPLNNFEGYNGNSTLVAISGLSYPFTYINSLGELAKQALAERTREAGSVKKLESLNLYFNIEKTEKTNKPIKKKSKLDLIRELSK